MELGVVGRESWGFDGLFAAVVFVLPQLSWWIACSGGGGMQVWSLARARSANKERKHRGMS
jgi:hypothetical protein